MPIVTGSTTTSSFTHTGVVRSKNEDALLALPKSGLWAVADGMGGHEDGDFASSCVIGHLYQLAMHHKGIELVQMIPSVIQLANDEILHQSSIGASRRIIGTTLVALVLEGENYHCFWSGDSRCYLLRGDQLHPLTTDHTRAEEMRASGQYTEVEISTNPESHALIHAIGVDQNPFIDCVQGVIYEGDRFLLCSDGLTKVYDDYELTLRVQNSNIDQVNMDFLSDALVAGAPDNISSVLVSL